MSDSELKKQVKNLGPAEVARRAGLKLTTLLTWMKTPTANLRSGNHTAVIEAVRAMLGTQVSDSLSHGGETFYPVPIFDIRAAAGAGALVEDGEPTSYQMFRENWLRTLTRASLEKLSGITVSGDSMEPSLRNGDQILVDRSFTRVRGEGIYVLLVDDVLQVKRLQRSPKDGSLEVMSDNQTYRSYRLDPNEERNVHIIGRVLWFGRALV